MDRNNNMDRIPNNTSLYKYFSTLCNLIDGMLHTPFPFADMSMLQHLNTSSYFSRRIAVLSILESLCLYSGMLNMDLTADSSCCPHKSLLLPSLKLIADKILSHYHIAAWLSVGISAIMHSTS